MSDEMDNDETTYKKLYEESLVKIEESLVKITEAYDEGYGDGYGDGKAEKIFQLPTFTKWGDMEKYIIAKTKCKPFSSEGINYRKSHEICILRSTDNTEYYDDDLRDINRVDYTLTGKSGDQDVNSTRNRNLLNPDLKHIYLYRAKKDGKKPTSSWIWYGEYTIVGRTTKQHIGEDSFMREIIKLSLKRM